MNVQPKILALIGVALTAAVATGYVVGRESQPNQAVEAPTRVNNASEAATTEQAYVKRLPPTEQLARAFYAAFGDRKSADRMVDVGDGQMETVTYEPARLFWTEHGPILLSSGSWAVGMAGVGYISIHYLQPEGSTFRVRRQWLTAIPGSGNGNPPREPMLSRKFSEYPVIYTESGFTHMGQTCGYFELTELRPDGPHFLGSFLESAFSDDGSNGVEGKFAKVSENSFQLVFMGRTPSRVSYVRRGDRYVFGGPGEEPEC